MSEQIKVGEWVHHDPKDMDGVLLATHHEWAWVDYGGRFPLCELRENLTRIEPAVPQPLFRVGQRVAIKNGQKDHLEIAEIEYHYRLRCLPHNAGLDGEIEFKGGLTHCTYSEADLGAVPDEVVCPTCGGKVADG